MSKTKPDEAIGIDRCSKCGSAMKRKPEKAVSEDRRKVKKVMHEYKHGELHSGSKKGPKVKSRKQAVAIALSEARKLKKNRK
jgi:hypothetical protein